MPLDDIKMFLEENTVVVLGLLSVSIAANLFEITGYFRQRRAARHETLRRREEEERLRALEFMTKIAAKSAKTDAELEQIQQDIEERKASIPALEKKIDLLRLAAKKEVVGQSIERILDEIRTLHEQLQDLRRQHSSLGHLPDLPAQERRSIESEIERSTQNRLELPKALTFRSIILVLIIVLLPSPADTLLIVIFLSTFLKTFFEVASLSPEESLRDWTRSHWRGIGLLSSVGAWYYLLQTANHFLARPIDFLIASIQEIYFESSIRYENFLIETLLRRSYILDGIILILVALLIGRIHWRRTQRDIEKLIEGDSIPRAAEESKYEA